MDTSTPPSTTSKGPTTSSRAAARARMRARAAASAQQQLVDHSEREESSHSNTENNTVSPTSSLEQSNRRPHQLPIRKPSCASGNEATLTPAFSPTTSSRLDPATIIRTSSAAHGRGLTAARVLERRLQDPDHPIPVRREINQESFTQEQSHTQNAGWPPVIYTRPQVRLYLNEYDESYHSKPGPQIDPTDSNSHEYYSIDYESDLPYMPGQKAENDRRCRSWLRNVERGGD